MHPDGVELTRRCCSPILWRNPVDYPKMKTFKLALRTIGCLALLSPCLALAGDNSLGTWKLNVDKSDSGTPTQVARFLTSTRVASHGAINVTVTGERFDGTKIHSTYTVKYDGKEHPVTGASFDRIAIMQVDDNTFTVVTKQAAGKYHTTGEMLISKDGKTMTTSYEGTDAAGNPMKFKFVWDKQ
jgi:hypothetical protein